MHLAWPGNAFFFLGVWRLRTLFFFAGNGKHKLYNMGYIYIHIASYKARGSENKKKTMVRYGMEWNGMEMLPAAWLHCLQLQVINFTTTRF